MIEAINDNPSVLIQVVEAFDMTKYWDMYISGLTASEFFFMLCVVELVSFRLDETI